MTPLKRYADQLGWLIAPEGVLYHSAGFSISFKHDSSRQIATVLKQWWPSFLVTQCDRKGLQGLILHFNITRDVFQKFSPPDQKSLIRNLLGGFQVQAVKHKWLTDAAATCQLCGVTESRRYCSLERPNLEDVRDLRPKAVKICGMSVQIGFSFRWHMNMKMPPS